MSRQTGRCRFYRSIQCMLKLFKVIVKIRDVPRSDNSEILLNDFHVTLVSFLSARVFNTSPESWNGKVF